MTDPEQAAQEGLNIGEMVLHHTADAWTIDFDLYFTRVVWHLPRWPDIHIFGLTLNLSPTKHVIFMLFAAGLVFAMMWLAARSLKKSQASGRPPKGFAGAVEASVLWVRNEIVLPNIPHGERFAPFIQHPDGALAVWLMVDIDDDVRPGVVGYDTSDVYRLEMMPRHFPQHFAVAVYERHVVRAATG